jgi:hypothetical protein
VLRRDTFNQSLIAVENESVTDRAFTYYWRRVKKHVAEMRRARVQAGRLMAMSLPAWTRARRRLRLILKDPT